MRKALAARFSSAFVALLWASIASPTSAQQAITYNPDFSLTDSGGLMVGAPTDSPQSFTFEDGDNIQGHVSFDGNTLTINDGRDESQMRCRRSAALAAFA